MSAPDKEHLTHTDEAGRLRMVDISGKSVTTRVATAGCFVAMSPATLDLLAAGGLKKGDAITVARVAGIMAAKRTSELIPLCHPLALTDVNVEIRIEPGGVRVEATAKTADRTGVEMEAMVAVSVAALTLYDMCKGSDKSIVIEEVKLLAKSGGKSGDWKRDA